MKNFILLLVSFSIISSCKKDTNTLIQPAPSETNILMLKVDFKTNVFEEASINSYQNAATFTVTEIFKPPTDFGNLTLKYQETNDTIFSGDLVWLGKGEILHPLNFQSANQFSVVSTTDTIIPSAGFQNVSNQYNITSSHDTAWYAVQKLSIVRDYLYSNPNASVKYFLYLPSHGVGNPLDYKWIFILKEN